MENFSVAELVELTQMFKSSMDDQFQYWLTATFGVIVATFVAKNNLNKQLRVIVSVFYISASILFCLNYFQETANYLAYMEAARERGAVLGQPYVLAGTFRPFIFIAGAITTLWFLNFMKLPENKLR